jgi:vacuolar-type H+-ATPase subunit H
MPGGIFMEFVMKKIMNIDNDAQIYRNGIDELLKEKQQQTEKRISDIRFDWEKEAKAIKESILKKRLEEAEDRAENIRFEKVTQISSIKAKYESNKAKIVEEIFNKIISSP